MTTTEEFMRLFRRSAWRLETLPRYNPRTDAALAHWLATGELLPLDQRPGKQAWMAAVRQAVAQGRRLGRVRVLGDDAYEAYALACYPENAAAGEDVRVADPREHPDLAELDTDFWLLDDDLVLVMDYDQDGQFLDLTPTRLPAVQRMARRRRDVAVARSVPLADYLAAIEVGA